MPSGKNAWLTFLTFDLLIKIVILHALLAVSMTNILLVGGASAASAATVRSSKLRFVIDICLVRANHTEHARMAITFDGQRSRCRSDVAGISLDVEKTSQCAKEEVSSSLLGKLAPPFLCYSILL